MRRFDQVIRHRNHFGKHRPRLNDRHQIRQVRSTRQQVLLSRPTELMLFVKGATKISKIDEALRTRRIVTLFFAFLSGISAVSTAVVPAILHI